jgi:hypothetical protein
VKDPQSLLFTVVLVVEVCDLEILCGNVEDSADAPVLFCIINVSMRKRWCCDKNRENIL